HRGGPRRGRGDHLVRQLRDRLSRLLHGEQREGDGRVSHRVFRLQRLHDPDRSVPGGRARGDELAPLPLSDRPPGRARDPRPRPRACAPARGRAVGLRDAAPRGGAHGLAARARPLRRVRRLIVRRYLRLLWIQLRTSWILALQYRSDFVIEGLIEVFWTVTAM